MFKFSAIAVTHSSLSSEEELLTNYFWIDFLKVSLKQLQYKQ